MGEQWYKSPCPACGVSNWRYIGHEQTEDDPDPVTRCWGCGHSWVEEGVIQEWELAEYEIGEGLTYATLAEWAKAQTGVVGTPVPEWHGLLLYAINFTDKGGRATAIVAARDEAQAKTFAPSLPEDTLWLGWAKTHVAGLKYTTQAGG